MQSLGLPPKTHMIIHLDMPTDLVAHLTDEAVEKGLGLDAYILHTVVRRRVSNKSEASDAAAGLPLRRGVRWSLRELRKGNRPGPDLTVRDLIEEVRRF
jgi:hypothetical protein